MVRSGVRFIVKKTHEIDENERLRGEPMLAVTEKRNRDTAQYY